MIKYLLSLIFLLSVTAASAQRNIVESLQTDRPGQGKVTVHQDAGITALIGSRYVKATATEAQRTLKAEVSVCRCMRATTPGKPVMRLTVWQRR